jgi:hypothetical protein
MLVADSSLKRGKDETMRSKSPTGAQTRVVRLGKRTWRMSNATTACTRHPGGPPSAHSLKLAAKLCELIGDGMSSDKACRTKGMPHPVKVYRCSTTMRISESPISVREIRHDESHRGRPLTAGRFYCVFTEACRATGGLSRGAQEIGDAGRQMRASYIWLERRPDSRALYREAGSQAPRQARDG